MMIHDAPKSLNLAHMVCESARFGCVFHVLSAAKEKRRGVRFPVCAM